MKDKLGRLYYFKSGMKFFRISRKKKRKLIRYKLIYMNGKVSLEHRVLIEQKIGRKLERFEFVHHIDGNIFNNNLGNLKIVTPKEHMDIHKTGKKFSK